MEPYIGEIRLFAGDYAPEGWLICDGRELNINEHHDLFMLLGNTYGGDYERKKTYCLPDLRGCVPVHQGQGPDLTHRSLGKKGGTRSVELSVVHLPAHSHTPQCQTTSTTGSAQYAIWGDSPGGKAGKPVYSTKTDTPMNSKAIAPTGGGEPHNNMQPYVALNFIIAVKGIFPPR